MKATIKRTIEETFDVKLPCFVRNSSHYYKITTPERAVQVYLSEYFDPAISIVGINVAFSGEWMYCNSEDFANAFEQAISKIENLAYAPIRQEVENDAN